VYADNRRAVVITHDREFTRRRMKNTIGRHVRLDCEQPDGPQVIAAHLDELVAVLEEAHDLVVVVSASECSGIPHAGTRVAGPGGSDPGAPGLVVGVPALTYRGTLLSSPTPAPSAPAGGAALMSGTGDVPVGGNLYRRLHGG
jgi:hypothetical protein